MVNNNQVRHVPEAECIIKVTSGGRRRIKNGPIYCLETAKDLLDALPLLVVNEKAKVSKAKRFTPEMTDDELTQLIYALDQEEHYVESERCDTTEKITLDCDAYTIYWNRYYKREDRNAAKVYIKFGFSQSDPTLMVVSIKPSDW